MVYYNNIFKSYPGQDPLRKAVPNPARARDARPAEAGCRAARTWNQPQASECLSRLLVGKLHRIQGSIWVHDRFAPFSCSGLPTLVHLAGASATPSKQANTFYHGQTDHLRLTPKTWRAFLMLQYCTCHALGLHVLCGSSSVGFCHG